MTGRGSRVRVAVLLAAVLLAAGAAWLFWDAAARRGAAQAGVDAAAAARDSVVAILTYQPATAQSTLEAAARERLTGKFLEDYTQMIKTVVVPDALRNAVTSTATVPAAAAVWADRRHAVVLAYIDRTMTVGSATPTQTNSEARVTLDKVDGRWLIAGFEPI